MLAVLDTLASHTWLGLFQRKCYACINNNLTAYWQVWKAWLGGDEVYLMYQCTKLLLFGFLTREKKFRSMYTLVRNLPLAAPINQFPVDQYTILLINLPPLYESLLPLHDINGPSEYFYTTPWALMHFTNASCHDNCNNINLVVKSLEYVLTTHTKKRLL